MREEYTSVIAINGTTLEQQPTTLDESPSFIYSDQTSISGVKERQTFGIRKKVEMTWEMAKPETVRTFLNLAGRGIAISYVNSDSPFTEGALAFVGVLTVKTSEYVRGGSGYSKLTVTIEDGSGYYSGDPGDLNFVISDEVRIIRVMSQSEYDSISEKQHNTVYMIKE